MAVVVDASVLIAIIGNEPEKAILVQQTRGKNLLAPESIPWEIGNAFSAMLKRNRVTVEQALQALDAYQQIPVRFVTVELSEALRIAAELNIYAYDAYLIRCSQKYGAPLLTLDRKLTQAGRDIGIQVVEV